MTRLVYSIGCPSPEDCSKWHAVFDTPMFRVHPVEDVSRPCTSRHTNSTYALTPLQVAGVSLSGALKNVVALAAGFVDGLGMGGNTKAAIIRVGLLEMSSFTLEFFPSASPQTFSHHSAGVADCTCQRLIAILHFRELTSSFLSPTSVITTSFGGRNRKCAEAFIKTGKTFDELETELLNGQKLQVSIIVLTRNRTRRLTILQFQGTLTAKEIFEFLKGRGRLEGCESHWVGCTSRDNADALPSISETDPLFSKVYQISYEGMDPKELFVDL